MYKDTELSSSLIKLIPLLVIEICLLVLIGVDKIKALFCEQASGDT